MNYKIFTDGASSGNPGPGGWGAVIVFGVASGRENAGEVIGVENFVTELGGAEKNTTNNRMELKAVIESLKWAREKASVEKLVIYTDSSYVKRGATEWIKNWQVQGWKSKVSKKEILNKDLWMEMAIEIDAVEKAANKTDGGKIEWKLVGGHIGIPGNERADVIATSFASSNSGNSPRPTAKSPELFSGKLVDYNNLHKIDLLNIADDATLVKEKSKSRSHSRAKAHSYVSLVGGAVRVHLNWADCERAVKGERGARFKKSISEEDEKNIIADFKS